MRIYRFYLAAILVMGLASVATATPPGWWSNRGVTTSQPADDYLAANLGQLKHVAVRAAAELNAALVGGAGSEINNLVANWDPNISNPTRDDYAALTRGQLKHVASLFYNRLAQVGYQGSPLSPGQVYPWSTATADDDDYAIANLGQLKYVFSFSVVTILPGYPGFPDGNAGIMTLMTKNKVVSLAGWEAFLVSPGAEPNYYLRADFSGYSNYGAVGTNTYISFPVQTGGVHFDISPQQQSYVIANPNISVPPSPSAGPAVVTPTVKRKYHTNNAALFSTLVEFETWFKQASAIKTLASAPDYYEVTGPMDWSLADVGVAPSLVTETRCEFVTTNVVYETPPNIEDRTCRFFTLRTLLSVPDDEEAALTDDPLSPRYVAWTMVSPPGPAYRTKRIEREFTEQITTFHAKFNVPPGTYQLRWKLKKEHRQNPADVTTWIVYDVVTLIAVNGQSGWSQTQWPISVRPVSYVENYNYSVDTLDSGAMVELF